jgi:hypothetical protein
MFAPVLISYKKESSCEYFGLINENAQNQFADFPETAMDLNFGRFQLLAGDSAIQSVSKTE